jgi:hypothetical protein
MASRTARHPPAGAAQQHRTAGGKARSARNAVRHGLCSEGWGHPEVIPAIERFGREVAGPAVGEERALAYRVAAAQVYLERARQAQHRLYCESPHGSTARDWILAGRRSIGRGRPRRRCRRDARVGVRHRL